MTLLPGLKNIRILTIAALLVALSVVAGFFKFPISEVLEIRFTAVPIAVAGALLGPGIAAIVGGLADIGGFIIMPTGPYFPGFTISGIVGGIIFGLLLHSRGSARVSIGRILTAVILNTVVVNMILNSLWLTIMYGKGGFFAVISARILKEIVMIPINTILIAAILNPIARIMNKGNICSEPQVSE